MLEARNLNFPAMCPNKSLLLRQLGVDILSLGDTRDYKVIQSESSVSCTNNMFNVTTFLSVKY